MGHSGGAGSGEGREAGCEEVPPRRVAHTPTTPTTHAPRLPPHPHHTHPKQFLRSAGEKFEIGLAEAQFYAALSRLAQTEADRGQIEALTPPLRAALVGMAQALGRTHSLVAAATRRAVCGFVFGGGGAGDGSACTLGAKVRRRHTPSNTRTTPQPPCARREHTRLVHHALDAGEEEVADWLYDQAVRLQNALEAGTDTVAALQYQQVRAGREALHGDGAAVPAGESRAGSVAWGWGCSTSR